MLIKFKQSGAYVSVLLPSISHMVGHDSGGELVIWRLQTDSSPVFAPTASCGYEELKLNYREQKWFFQCKVIFSLLLLFSHTLPIWHPSSSPICICGKVSTSNAAVQSAHRLLRFDKLAGVFLRVHSIHPSKQIHTHVFPRKATGGEQPDVPEREDKDQDFWNNVFWTDECKTEWFGHQTLKTKKWDPWNGWIPAIFLNTMCQAYKWC